MDDGQWIHVEQAITLLKKIPAASARLELNSIGEKILVEKSKLKGMASKHDQACGELVRARKEVMKEREKMLDTHNRVENELKNIADNKDVDEALIRKNQLLVELTQIRRQLEQKKQEGKQYTATFSKSMHKKERLIQVQVKVVQNLLYRKVGLAEKLFSPNTTENTTGGNNQEEIAPEKKLSKQKSSGKSLRRSKSKGR